jgi:fructokinase
MEPFDLVCFGEVLYDVYETRKVLAGAPLNTASFASFLGLKTGLISAIGNTKPDEKIEQELTNRNVEPFLQRNNYGTGEAKIELDENKVPRFNIDPNSAYDHIRKTETLVNLAKNAGVFYFGTLCQRDKESRNTLMELLSARQTKTVYDVNLRRRIPSWESIVKNSLKHTSILKMNEEESENVKEITGCRNMKQLFDKTNVDYAFVTWGEKGAYLHQRNEKPYFVEAPEVDVVDTTGCGDAFTASLIYGFHKGWSGQRILGFAVDFASEVAQYEGAFDHEFLVESEIKPVKA